MTDKIAVLISGEYRTFDIAVKTMPFLQADNVDVYFSTWNKSEQHCHELEVDIVEDIDVTRIERALAPKKLTGSTIDRHTKFDKTFRYNTKMIDRWKRGLALIKNSGIKYRLIMVMRPDMAFRYILNPDYFCNLDVYIEHVKPDVMYTIWNTAANGERIDDVVFLSDSSTMFKAIQSVSMLEWNRSDNYDWHFWLWEHFRDKNVPTEKIFPYMVATFCRGNVVDGDDFDTINRKSIAWRNTHIERDRVVHGDEFVTRTWGPAILEELKLPWRLT